VASCEAEERGDSTQVEFRADGSLAIRRHHNPDGSEWTSTYEYDGAGRLVRVHTESVNQPIERQRYEYDAEGRLLRVVACTGGGSERIAESYEYSAAGQKTKLVHVDVTTQSSDTMCMWWIEGAECGYSVPGAATISTLHNACDQPTELLFLDKDAQTLSRVAFRYNETGHLVEAAQTMVTGVFPPHLLAEMSPADLEAVRAICESTSRRVFRYDARGRRIETQSSLFGTLGRDSKTTTYNDFGDQIGEVSEDESKDQEVSQSEARFLYDYDARGNWITKVVEARNRTHEDFYVSSTEQRTLTYVPT
jgi:YD repeat-containing protein